MKVKDIYENVIVMLYIIVLTVATAVIILYSSDIYSEVKNYNQDFEDLEIAMSYVNVKVRQKDKTGVISIKVVESSGENALVFTENGTSTWVFKHDNMLIETKETKGVDPTLGEYIKIADIEKFEVDITGKLLHYKIEVDGDLEETSTINLRSDS